MGLLNVAELGERVRRHRQEKGLTVRKSAAEAGVSPSTICRIENGIGTPDAATLHRVAQWLGIPLEGLLAPPRTEVVFRTEPPPLDFVCWLPSKCKSVDPATAAALKELFRVAYSTFIAPQDGGPAAPKPER